MNYDWKISFIGGIIIGLLISALIIGSLMIWEGSRSGIQTLPVHKTLPVHIVYQDFQDNYNGELAQVSSNEVIEGTLIYVKFYNLNPNQTYYISMSQVGKVKEFNNTEEITIVIRGQEDNFCYLGSNFRDIVWIWIGDI